MRTPIRYPLQTTSHPPVCNILEKTFGGNVPHILLHLYYTMRLSIIAHSLHRHGLKFLQTFERLGCKKEGEKYSVRKKYTITESKTCKSTITHANTDTLSCQTTSYLQVCNILEKTFGGNVHHILLHLYNTMRLSVIAHCLHRHGLKFQTSNFPMKEGEKYRVRKKYTIFQSDVTKSSKITRKNDFDSTQLDDHPGTTMVSPLHSIRSPPLSLHF